MYKYIFSYINIMEFDESLLVDFSDIPDADLNEPVTVQPKKQIEYDKETNEKYRVLRLRKMDPLLYNEVDDQYAFKFKYKWDPYTGERLEEDPNGPIYFDPDYLIKYFHTKRLDKLWVQPTDESNGYFEGYYDAGVGAGEDFHLASRGAHPEWYIFRIPIIDCYLTKDHNRQFITFGPKLTNEEILEIERLANLRADNYRMLFNRNRPSLNQMKELYDLAIAREPNKSIIEQKHKKESVQDHYNKINRQAVDQLVEMAG